MADQESKKPTLEESFAQLDSLAEQLESGEISLEDSFRVYEKGMQLLKGCSEQIDQVEKKMLQINEAGEPHEF